LFLAGQDWNALTDEQRTNPGRPIINLIQHQRHVDHRSGLRGFLKHHAVRICVSEEVANAIQQTGIVKGPVFVIPNGIDFSKIPAGLPWEQRKIDILILGLKAPDLAKDVAAEFSEAGINVQCVTDFVPRTEFVKLLGKARFTVFLPRPVEGFYLPALEGMAVGTIVICPDCEGNRGFCSDGSNCFRPKRNRHAIVAAIRAAIFQPEKERIRMLERARAKVLQHSIMNEREKFLRILTGIEL
jgi:glycosyltransferase involved in cell wall biosynthesis